MSEQDDIMAIAQTLVANEPAPPAAAETTPTEPAKTDQPKAGTEEAGKGDGKPSEVIAKKEDNPPPPKEDRPKTDWRAAAAAERQKQRDRQNGRNQTVQLQQQLQQAQAEMARWREIEELKTSDPLAAAEKAGFSYDTLTKKYIESLEKNPAQTAPEVKTLIQNFHQLEGMVQGLQEELREERRQKVVSGFDSEVQSLLQAKGDEFELTRTAKEGPTLVRAIVAAHWSKTVVRDDKGRILEDGETMPTEEACRKAEEYFEQQQLGQFIKTKKFAALARPPEAPKVEEKKSTSGTLTQGLLRGGGETQTFSGEFEELAALARRLEAQGN